MKRIYRKARPADIDKWEEARGRENATMIQSRQIAKELQLDMKIRRRWNIRRLQQSDFLLHRRSTHRLSQIDSRFGRHLPRCASKCARSVHDKKRHASEVSDPAAENCAAPLGVKIFKPSLRGLHVSKIFRPIRRNWQDNAVNSSAA